MSSLVVLFINLLFILPVYSSGGFSISLMHRDSPDSPFYNASLSHFHRLRAAAGRSIAHANHFRASAASNGKTIVSEVRPDDKIFEYLMTLKFGTPPSEYLAVVDTGSDLIWTQCEPCVDCFDPESSSTYRTISCDANICSDLPMRSCSGSSTCQYKYSYGDGSYTDGILSSETLTFDSIVDGKGENAISIPNIVFGCSRESTGTFDETEGRGLVGLGGGPLSLVSQLASSIGNKFSYCLVPHSNQNSASTLNFGGNATVVGPNVVTTPIVDGDVNTFYYLSLEDISVGDDKVGIGKGKIIIDSGTTLTILDDFMVQLLVDKIRRVVSYPVVDDSSGSFDLCFDVSNSSGWDVGLPELTFEFSGAAVRLPPTNTFIAADERVVCLAIVSNGGAGGLWIFGNIAQQNWHIGYDLGAKKLSFAPQNCATLALKNESGPYGIGKVSCCGKVSCWCGVWAVVLFYVFCVGSLF